MSSEDIDRRAVFHSYFARFNGLSEPAFLPMRDNELAVAQQYTTPERPGTSEARVEEPEPPSRSPGTWLNCYLSSLNDQLASPAPSPDSPAVGRGVMQGATPAAATPTTEKALDIGESIFARPRNEVVGTPTMSTLNNGSNSGPSAQSSMLEGSSLGTGQNRDSPNARKAGPVFLVSTPKAAQAGLLPSGRLSLDNLDDIDFVFGMSNDMDFSTVSGLPSHMEENDLWFQFPD